MRCEESNKIMVGWDRYYLYWFYPVFRSGQGREERRIPIYRRVRTDKRASCAVGFLLLPAHELLHAIVYPNNANVSIGFILKSFAAVALVSFPLKKFRFIIMSLLPLVLGIVPIVMFICFPAEWIIANSIICGISVMGLISPYPDLYNVFQVLKQAPKNSYLQFHNDDLYYFIKEQ